VSTVSFDKRHFKATWLVVQCCGRPMEVETGAHFGGPCGQDKAVFARCPDCGHEVQVVPLTRADEEEYEEAE
jgi:hypothetical protein